MTRFLFITYEYTTETFSGNGVLSASQINALRSLGHEVFVIFACPETAAVGETRKDEVPILVPSTAWGTLQNSCAWKEFADGAGEAAKLRWKACELSSCFEAVFCVDWHAVLAWQRICNNSTPSIPWVFLSYRIFSRDDTSEKVILDTEAWAARHSSLTITLSKADQIFVQDEGWLSDEAHCAFLPPGIRPDVAALPHPSDISYTHACTIEGADESSQFQMVSMPCTEVPHPTGTWPCKRARLLLCCVRISPEKQPATFVAAAAELSRSGVFKRLDVQPMLLAPSQTAYADSIVKEFEEKVPEGCVDRRFLSAEQLAEVFAQTVLNVHPCEYDAYGMTVVEAASQGAPSLLQQGGTVGASHVLSPDRGESFAGDMGMPCGDLALRICGILEVPKLASQVAHRACVAARKYDSLANGEELLRIVQTYCS